MRFCRDCNSKMVGVLSFSKDKNERFDKCPNCYGETKHRKISDKELSFVEVLDKAMRNRK